MIAARLTNRAGDFFETAPRTQALRSPTLPERPFGGGLFGRKKGGLPAPTQPIKRPAKLSPPKPSRKTRGRYALMNPTDQTEQRRRRRAQIPLAYDGGFDLCAEVAAIVDRLAQRVAVAPQPLLFRSRVLELADATHELVSTVVGWLAEFDARAKTAHLAHDSGKRRYAMTTLIDLALRPALPEIADAALADGSWASRLIEMAAPSTEPLADLLSRSWPPNAEALRGRPSRSERLTERLRAVDRAALALKRRLDWAESLPPARLQPSEAGRTEQARAELAAMGVEL